MNKITFYEQVGIVIPGSVFMFGLLFFFPALQTVLMKDGASLGDLGIFVKNGKPERIDTLNGMYGLNRGLASATFALACVAAAQGRWFVALALIVLTAVYDYRAYRFGVYYGRELYLQFLVLTDTDEKKVPSETAFPET